MRRRSEIPEGESVVSCRKCERKERKKKLATINCPVVVELMDDPFVKERIDLLAQLHRPLEEHWSNAHGLGLDPKGSDHLYKHHITRLRKIYKDHVHEDSIPTPHRNLISVAPVTQLYGWDGLKSKAANTPEKLHTREEKWVNDVQLNTKREQKMKAQKKPPLPWKASSGIDISSDAAVSTSIQSPKSSVGRKDVKIQHSTSKKSKKYRCLNPNLSHEDLIMLGLYRFNEHQSTVYDSFVEMLLEFDPEDVLRILEDVVHDVKSSTDMQGYCGFDH